MPPKKSTESRVFSTNLLILLGYVLLCAAISALTRDTIFIVFSFYASIAHPFILILTGIIYLFSGSKTLGKSFLITGFAFIIVGPFLSCAANVFFVESLGLDSMGGR